jgi:hypothetical protein
MRIIIETESPKKACRPGSDGGPGRACHRRDYRALGASEKEAGFASDFDGGDVMIALRIAFMIVLSIGISGCFEVGHPPYNHAMSSNYGG